MARAVADDSRARLRRRGRLLLGRRRARGVVVRAYHAAIDRGRTAERRWQETGEAETIPAVGPDGGDVAMPLHEAYEFYGTSRGGGPTTNAFAVQSFAYTTSFGAQEAAAVFGCRSSSSTRSGPLPHRSRGSSTPRSAHKWELGCSRRGRSTSTTIRLIDPAVDAIAEHLTGTLA